MNLEWTKHLRDPEEKDRFTGRVLGSREILNRIRDLIDEKEKSLDRSEMTIDIYGSENWDYRQAHKNGNRESLAWLKKLVDLDQQKDTKI